MRYSFFLKKRYIPFPPSCPHFVLIHQTMQLSIILRICVTCGKATEKPNDRSQWFKIALGLYEDGTAGGLLRKPALIVLKVRTISHRPVYSFRNLMRFFVLKTEILTDLASTHFANGALDVAEKYINQAIRVCISFLVDLFWDLVGWCLADRKVRICYRLIIWNSGYS